LAEKNGRTGVLRELPVGYYLEQYQDVLVLRRLDGSLIAAFSSQSAAPETMQQPTKETGDEEAFAGRREASSVASPAKPGLHANFFGCFELLRDGENVPLGHNAKALAILKYLLTHQARPVPQDYLMDWLWPKSALKKARWSLNSAICALRKLLGRYLPSLPASETVLFERGRYRVTPRIRLSTDTDEFDSHYEEGCRLEKASRVSEAVAEYEKAARLYRDDYLIEDLYEDWTAVERQRLTDAYIDLSRRLAVCYMEDGQLQESVQTCYRILEKDRCNEDAHRLLMGCFVCLGQRARALCQHRLCEGALRREY